MALWIIAVLAVMVLSFSFEAHQQAGINVYVRERNRGNGRLTRCRRPAGREAPQLGGYRGDLASAPALIVAVSHLRVSRARSKAPWRR